ncbi:MAG: ferrous iron transport protein B [Deltaproteobacteria bacterium]|nr:ferrous iron transport protein B [Deltaproteobacteria bacterium]
MKTKTKTTENARPIIALAGNPNSGKSTVFNRLTGLHQRVGNYPGITVERTSGRLRSIRASRSTPTGPSTRTGEPGLGRSSPGESRRVEGFSALSADGAVDAEVLDLPGAYSLVGRSREETLTYDFLKRPVAEGGPSLILIVVDASNLGRNLYFALSVLELGIPSVVVLNMVDEAEALGVRIDALVLSRALKVPVVPVVASKGIGMADLYIAIAENLRSPVIPGRRVWRLDAETEEQIAHLTAVASGRREAGPADSIERSMPADSDSDSDSDSGSDSNSDAATAQAQRQEAVASRAEAHVFWMLGVLATEGRASGGAKNINGMDGMGGIGGVEGIETFVARVSPDEASHLFSRVIEARHQHAEALANEAMTVRSAPTRRASMSDRIDTLVLHRFLGPLIFAAVMAALFQSVFSWSAPAMDRIEAGFAALMRVAGDVLPPGVLTSLLTDGIINGVGSVLVFVPQIAILFAFIAVLEDSGYLARAAFIMDRLMARIGLHGKAFVPLLSGFACAVPAIMSARTVENPKDRLVTILVTPLMSCSARLPVYSVILGALFATRPPIFGFFSVAALLMLSMYALSIIATLAAAALLKRTVLKSATPPLVLELPPYRWPLPGSVLRRATSRCAVFVRDAGTVILACSIILWALLSYPKLSPTEDARFDAERSVVEETVAAGPARDAALSAIENRRAARQVERSIAGRLGHAMEPVIAPLGFDWRIGIGLIGSFAAREVLVSTLGLVHGLGAQADEDSPSLRETLRRDPHYTPLVGFSLMIFFLFACQCMSTLAVIRRETASWRWPAFVLGYMTVLAYVASLLVYQVGRLFGLA